MEVKLKVESENSNTWRLKILVLKNEAMEDLEVQSLLLRLLKVALSSLTLMARLVAWIKGWDWTKGPVPCLIK
ncbi:hypothetical protein TorRG33x02_171570 [Trema orientale]|uniref:Uncharacterized protein n=1 Tax=Trema orientale TaxID=63057 RepID=A0A2P5ENB5_TREOI|nr:hypothetical protein TorRG33x02_171570 [Trema orientale]